MRIFPVIRRVTSTIAGGTATALWAEDSNVADEPVMGAVLTEDASVDDAFAYLIAKEGEDSQVDDAWSQFILSAYAEDTNVNDLTQIQVLSVDVSRTGTPDSDMMFDAWTDQASPSTNHGNESLKCKGASVAPGSDVRNAYIAIDLTALTGFTGVNLLNGNTQAFSITIQVANSNGLLASSMNWSLRYTTLKPFTESTVAYNAAGNLGTAVNITSGSVSVPAGGGFSAFTIGTTAALMAPAWGNWLVLFLTGANGAAPDTYTIKSRDDATTANRPTFSLAIQRGT